MRDTQRDTDVRREMKDTQRNTDVSKRDERYTERYKRE
jgi:hypothetical protein